MKGLSKGRYDETFAGEDENYKKKLFIAVYCCFGVQNGLRLERERPTC